MSRNPSRRVAWSVIAVKIFAKSLKTFPLHDLWNSRNSIWPHLNVRDFNDRFGATFTLEDNQQEKDFFNKFFPRELIEKITTETNNYATKCIEEKPERKASFKCNHSFINCLFLWGLIIIQTCFRHSIQNRSNMAEFVMSRSPSRWVKQLMKEWLHLKDAFLSSSTYLLNLPDLE
jgi:hypothetical protein